MDNAAAAKVQAEQGRSRVAWSPPPPTYPAAYSFWLNAPRRQKAWTFPGAGVGPTGEDSDSVDGQTELTEAGRDRAQETGPWTVLWRLCGSFSEAGSQGVWFECVSRVGNLVPNTAASSCGTFAGKLHGCGPFTHQWTHELSQAWLCYKSSSLWLARCVSCEVLCHIRRQ